MYRFGVIAVVVCASVSSIAQADGVSEHDVLRAVLGTSEFGVKRDVVRVQGDKFLDAAFVPYDMEGHPGGVPKEERTRFVSDRFVIYEYSDSELTVELHADGYRVENGEQELLSDPSLPHGPHLAWAFATTQGPPGATSDSVQLIMVLPNGASDGHKLVWDESEQKYVLFKPPPDAF